MDITFINALELLAAFQAFLFAVYLLGSKKTKSLGNIFIALFLVLLGINLLQDYLRYFLEPIMSNLYSFLALTFFLLPASLYLYNKSVLRPDFRLTKKSFWHTLPYISTNVIITPLVYLENLKEIPVESPILKPINMAFYLFFYLLLLGYQIASFRLLKNNKQLYFENFSNTDIQRYSYLRQLNIIFTLLFCVSAIKNFLVFNTEGPVLEALILTLKLALLFFFCWIGYIGVNKPFIFSMPMEHLKPVKDLIEKNLGNFSLKPKVGILKNGSENEKMLEKVKNYMKTEEPYLDASLSISDLAEKVQMQSKELSILINHYLNQHFFDFVNGYRIEKAMQLLRDPENEKITVLEVLYQVGFNSKSSFNTAFKKHSGTTPTHYKRKYSLSAA